MAWMNGFVRDGSGIIKVSLLLYKSLKPSFVFNLFLVVSSSKTNFKMHITTLLTLAMTATASAAQTVYLIRHGEKPADGGDGLTIAGQQRAQCLRTVFGNASQYNIGKILAQTPKASMSTPSYSLFSYQSWLFKAAKEPAPS
jgi:hypothetical protein